MAPLINSSRWLRVVHEHIIINMRWVWVGVTIYIIFHRHLLRAIFMIKNKFVHGKPWRKLVVKHFPNDVIHEKLLCNYLLWYMSSNPLTRTVLNDAPLRDFPPLMFLTFHNTCDDENLPFTFNHSNDFFPSLFNNSKLCVWVNTKWKSSQIDIVLDQWTLMLIIFGHQPRTNLSHFNEEVFTSERYLWQQPKEKKTRKKACQVTFPSLACWGRKKKKSSFRCVGIFFWALAVYELWWKEKSRPAPLVLWWKTQQS